MGHYNLEKEIEAARKRLIIAEKDYSDTAAVLSMRNDPKMIREYILSVKQSIIDQEKQIIESFTWAISKNLFIG